MRNNSNLLPHTSFFFFGYEKLGVESNKTMRCSKPLISFMHKNKKQKVASNKVVDGKNASNRQEGDRYR